jgi:hypothetical protein
MFTDKNDSQALKHFVLRHSADCALCIAGFVVKQLPAACIHAVGGGGKPVVDGGGGGGESPFFFLKFLIKKKKK